MLKHQQGLINKAVIFLALLALILSFTAQFNVQITRIFGAIWNLGHVVAFYIWTYLCLRYTKWLEPFSFIKQLLLVVVFSLIFGVLIEVVQVQVGRAAEAGDLLSDVLGGVLALCFHSKSRKNIQPNNLSILKSVLLISILILHKNILLMPINDYYIYQQFPILLNPSTPFEATRFEKDRDVQFRKIIEKQSYYEIQFSTRKKYSSIFIHYFPKDWSDYKFLILDVVNPENRPYQITCRINDFEHNENEQKYEDRFNQSFLLKPGKNQIKIEVDKIRHAPARRQMDLAEIASIGIFTIDLKEQKKMHILKMELIN